MHEKELLKEFCGMVQGALEELDSGNGERWPAPPGVTDFDNFQGPGKAVSRWHPLWNELNKVRNYYGV